MNSRLQKFIMYLNNSESNTNSYSELWLSMIKSFKVFGSDLRELDNFIRTSTRGYSLVTGNKISSKLHEKIQLTIGAFQYYTLHFFNLLIDFPIKKAVYLLSLSLVKLTGHKYHTTRIYDRRLFLINRFLKNTKTDVKGYLKEISVKQNYNTLKCIYFAEKIMANCKFKTNDKVSILEIGAGTGNLAIFLSNKISNVNYYIVDLPEMLLITSHQLNKYLREANQILPNEKFEVPVKDGINFILLVPEQIDLIPKETIDLAINIESFAEMNMETVNWYLPEVYNSLKQGGYFFTANRESREIVKDRIPMKVNTIWNYPFKDDKIIMHEYCPMRDFVYGMKKRNINRLSVKFNKVS